MTAEPTGSVSPASFEFIRRFLRQQTAIELSDDKVYLVNSRLGELARELKLSGPEQVAQELQRRPQPDLCRRVAESQRGALEASLGVLSDALSGRSAGGCCA